MIIHLHFISIASYWSVCDLILNIKTIILYLKVFLRIIGQITLKMGVLELRPQLRQVYTFTPFPIQADAMS